MASIITKFINTIIYGHDASSPIILVIWLENVIKRQTYSSTVNLLYYILLGVLAIHACYACRQSDLWTLNIIMRLS